MRVSNRTVRNSLYIIDSFNITGKVEGYQKIHKTTGSMRDAKEMARRELALGASHVNISKVVCHCFPK